MRCEERVKEHSSFLAFLYYVSAFVQKILPALVNTFGSFGCHRLLWMSPLTAVQQSLSASRGRDGQTSNTVR